jgi:hypothetical protein
MRCVSQAAMCGVIAGVNDDLDGSDVHKAVSFHVTNITRDRGVAPGAPPSEPER